MSYLPTKEDYELIEKIKSKIKDKVKKCLIDVDHKLVFAGSTALGTFTRGEYDIDAFIVSKNKDKAFNKITKCIDGTVKKGELDIWHTTMDGVDVDMVFLDPEHPKTQTLKHTEHYSKILTDDLKKEIIKAKALMKGRGCYGAELGGITGIALTELIAKYKNLDKACEVLEKDSSMKLPDPTRPERNLLASVTKKRWECIKNACEEYRKTGYVPTEKYDDEKFKREMESKSYKVLQLDRKDDVAIDFTRAMSSCVKCGNELKNIEKDVEVDCNAYVKSKVNIAYKAPETLPETKKVKIPLTVRKEALDAFIKAHPDAVKENGYLVAKVERKITKPKEWMEKCIIKKF